MKRLIFLATYVGIILPSFSQNLEFVDSNQIALGYNGTSYVIDKNSSLTLAPGFSVDAATDGEFVAKATDGFVTTWKTDNPGDTNNDQFKIPTYGSGYDYSVEWINIVNSSISGESSHTGEATITVDQPGEYLAIIKGDFPRIRFYNSGDNSKIKSIDQWGNIEWNNMEVAFYACDNLTLEAKDAPDLTNVTDLTAMFYRTQVNTNISHWDVNNVTHMAVMFAETPFNQNLGGLSIPNVQSLGGIFRGASMSTENYDNTLIGWSTQSVQSGVIFQADGLKYCESVDERQQLIDNHNWNIYQDAFTCGIDVPFELIWEIDVTNTNDFNIKIPTEGDGYDYMVTMTHQTTGEVQTHGPFYGDATIQYNLFNVDPGPWKVSILGDFPRIHFEKFTFDDEAEEILSIEQWGDNQWFSMEGAFAGCSNMVINATDAPDLNKASSTAKMFAGCSSINSNMSHWNVSTINDMSYMFNSASTFNGNISNWDVEKVTNMERMFSNARAFDGNISNWKVQNVENMAYMFSSTDSFNGNIGGWNVGKVTNMEGMFSYADVFNTSINAWDVRNVTNMRRMFNVSGYNQPLNSWEVGKVTDMSEMFRFSPFDRPIDSWDVDLVENMSGMFEFNSFNQPINSWNVSEVTNMSRMFRENPAFDQPLYSWGDKLSKVTDMSLMFRDATSFNQNLNTWYQTTGNVSNMSSMFQGASSFNHSIGVWDITSVTTMNGMLSNCGMGISQYAATLSGWANSGFSNPVPSGVTLSAHGLSYCNTIARDQLTNTYSWTIYGDTDASNDPVCDGPPLVPNLPEVDSDKIESISIFPNPVQDIVTIEIADEESDLMISDFMGRSIDLIKLNSGKNSIDISAFESGTYFFTIISSDQNQTIQKVVKQ